eukprot:4915365-Prymnesium_polylepis.1
MRDGTKDSASRMHGARVDRKVLASSWVRDPGWRTRSHQAPSALVCDSAPLSSVSLSATALSCTTSGGAIRFISYIRRTTFSAPAESPLRAM